MLPLGSIVTDSVKGEPCYNEVTSIDIWYNNQFGSHDMAVLY